MTKTIESVLTALKGSDLCVSVPDDLSEVLSPDWDAGGRAHNWRNHVPNCIADAWDGLSEDARLVAYVMAEKLAGEEHWD